MSFAGPTSFVANMHGVAHCPTCDLPAITEERFALRSTDGPVEHLRLSCISGHGSLLLADRVRYVAL